MSGPVLGTVRSWRTCCAILSHFVPERWFENVPSWHTFASAEGVLEGRNHGTCPLERTGRTVSPRQPGLEHGPGGERVPGWDVGGAKRAEELGDTIDFMPVASLMGFPLSSALISL